MSGLSLDNQRTWLHAVLDLLPFPALLVEPGSGRVLFANESAARLPIGGTIGDHRPVPSGATDADGRPIPDDALPNRRAARGEVLDGFEISWPTDGERATFLVSSGTVPAMLGHAPMAVLTYQDVSRLKAAEAELRRALHARDEFFAVATHELKDPLSALLLSVEVLQRLAARQGAIPAPLLAQQLEVSKRQGGRLARMIENLLDVSRIASGRASLDVEAFDLCALVHELAARFRDQASQAGSPLIVGPCAATIGYFDRMKLEHAIGNLLSNAIKYGEGRPITIRLLGDETTARVEVEDLGIGIAAADHGRIFERFERATGDHGAGSLGLGLYIVRSIAEAHGGDVRLRSEPGRGSTFAIELPRKRVAREAATGRESEG